MVDNDTDKLVVDVLSFTSPERLECQTRFDAPYGELLECVFDAVRTLKADEQPTRIIDRDGNQHFPDQIIQFMLWVQTKRERPDAQLEEFNDLRWGDLSAAYVRGRVGKPTSKLSGKRKKPSTGAGSADSSE